VDECHQWAKSLKRLTRTLSDETVIRPAIAGGAQTRLTARFKAGYDDPPAVPKGY